MASNSYQTALCLIPPPEICRGIDSLRSRYDPSHNKWPPHINVLYPFVEVENLDRALEILRATLRDLYPHAAKSSFNLSLGSVEFFARQYGDVIYLAPSSPLGQDSESLAASENIDLQRIRSAFLENFPQPQGFSRDSYHPHLTIGRTEAGDNSSRASVMEEARTVLPLQWSVGSLAILVRDKCSSENAVGKMNLWATLDLTGNITVDDKIPTMSTRRMWEEAESSSFHSPSIDVSNSGTGRALSTIQSRLQQLRIEGVPNGEKRDTYHFNDQTGGWQPVRSTGQPANGDHLPQHLAVSSYNVLVESSEMPAKERYPLLCATLLSDSAVADVVILQEVSNDFLCYLLAKDEVRQHWPYSSHGSPDTPGCGPLSSFCNTVILSRWLFSWEWLAFKQQHKGAVIARLEAFGISASHLADDLGESHFLPLVIAGVHLTSGLNDKAVLAKQSQLQVLLGYLSNCYAENRWIIGGDFNLTTSASTIDAALRSRFISLETTEILSSLEMMLTESGLLDTWLITKVNASGPVLPSDAWEQMQEGEEGATFDPLVNPLAATSVGDRNNRPQRYDRIYVRGHSGLDITSFDMFGLHHRASLGSTQSFPNLEEAGAPCGSDHYGIRATLKIDSKARTDGPDDCVVRQPQLEAKKASHNMANTVALTRCLGEHGTMPTEEQAKKRKEIIKLLESILLDASTSSAKDASDLATISTRKAVFLRLVPVGSYALGVWNSSSDIDCLCVGPISSKTFFMLARQRLRKASDLGVKILRTVNASSGMMLELKVKDCKVDLQYCAASAAAQHWDRVSQSSSADPLFSIGATHLKKLNAFRDMVQLRQTIPNLSVFRLAYALIKLWAQQRGIYSAKFGFLGGFHITLLLSRVCKLLSAQSSGLTAPDIICTFFSHYANFDWSTSMVFDPFFHQNPPRYKRVAQEPMVILSLHTPAINVARTSSVPATRAIVEEFKRADGLLSDCTLTWAEFLGASREAEEFLGRYKTYIKIDVQCWHSASTKGRKFVGWLESRCLALLVDLSRKLPSVYARIWPARFTYSAPSDRVPTEHQGCYLIGLSQSDEVPEGSSERKLGPGILRSSLDQFADQIRSNETYFDASCLWVDVTLIKKSEVGEPRLDEGDWGYDVELEDSDDDLDETDTDDHDLEEIADASPAPKPSKTTPGAPAAKLRPAIDILNRIRWDPSLDINDYIIGYEDRFTGVIEMPLHRWKGELTDDEFIPQHRIVYFKRKSDGAVLWDRRSRRDAFFGSGIGE